MNKRQLVADLIAKRNELRNEVAGLVDSARADNERALSDVESARFDAAETEIRELDARVRELDEQIRADDASAEMEKRYAPSGVQVVSEPEIYRSGHSGRSYFRDLHLGRNRGDRDALDRLTRNTKAREAETRGITTVNGAGGEFVPPKWLEDNFVRLARPGRVTANLIQNMPLPPGTDSINIPKVSTGTAVAVQGTQNTAIQQTDLATTSISSSVTTIAGGQVVSLQLLEQSPLNIDDVVLSDLAAAYAQQYNTLVLSGSGVGGNPTGILTLAGTTTIDTTGTVSVGEIYSHVANAIQSVHTARFLPPDTIIMHPRRWAFLCAAVDTTGRPLVLPVANAYNPLATSGEVAAQGYVGTMLGLPVYVDALIPTNLALDAGSGEDAIIVARLADLIQWEGNVRAEAFEQTYANQASVFVRLYNYMSFQPARYPASIAKITGSALVAPTFP
jgi:HK97 family phage major capsid protein